MKYQYKLVKENEGEEEISGLKGLRAQNELVLTPLGQYTTEEFIDILNDPKNLSGVHFTVNKKLEELETRVFGPTGRKVPDKEYIELYNTTYDSNDPFSPTNGPALYKTISQEIRGFQPGQKKEILSNGKRVAVFPVRTAENLDIVSEFFTKRMGEPAKKPDISTPTTSDDNLKFPVMDEKNLKKILDNAGLESGKDYKLGKQEVSEKMHAIVREEILKFYKK
jgi:hypothetical protein